jgi:uncharacterized protein
MLCEKTEPVRERLGKKLQSFFFDLTYFIGERRSLPGGRSLTRSARMQGDLVDDFDCLAGLVKQIPKSMDGGKSWERTFDFPEQESKLDVGAYQRT